MVSSLSRLVERGTVSILELQRFIDVKVAAVDESRDQAERDARMNMIQLEEQAVQASAQLGAVSQAQALVLPA